MAVLEFNSFYKMKEWLMKGEYTLPSIYYTKNDGKAYIDIPVNPLGDLTRRISNIKGMTMNSSNQLSSVLCSIMNGHFGRKLETEITDSDGNKHDVINKNVFTLLNNSNDDSTQTPAFPFIEFKHFKHYGEIINDMEDGVNKVHTIAANTFKGSNIVSVFIPEGITHISNKAFMDCKRLVKVFFPSTLVSIGKQAFLGCGLLDNVDIPPSVKIIDSAAFMGCSYLTKLTIPNGVEIIGKRAFHGTGIEKIVIPDSVYSLGLKAFGYCKNLKKVWIGQHCGNRCDEYVEELEKNKIMYNYLYDGFQIKNYMANLHPMAFYCSPVEKFIVDSRNPNVKTGASGELMVNTSNTNYKDGTWMIIKLPSTLEGHYIADESAKSMCYNLFEGKNAPTGVTSVNFSNINTIPKHCFSNNNYVTELYMPHIHKINVNPFNSSRITKVEIGGDDEFLENNSIIFCGNTNKARILFFDQECKITVPDGTKPLYRENPLWEPYFALNKTVIVHMTNQWEFSWLKKSSNATLYHDVVESFSNKGINNSGAIMDITLDGVPNYQFRIRSYGENNYDYVMVSQLNQMIDSGTSYNNTTLVKAHTRGLSNSGTSYTTVTFNDIPENENGFNNIRVIYRKDSSTHSFDDKGYVEFYKNLPDVNTEIYLQRFSMYGTNDYEYIFRSDTMGNTNPEQFATMRIYFKNKPNFKIYVGSSSEVEFDYIMVSPLDTSRYEDVCFYASNGDVSYIDGEMEWLATTRYDHNNITDINNKDGYIEVNIPNDGNYHFVEIYYIKDDSTDVGADRGYVIVPKK